MLPGRPSFDPGFLRRTARTVFTFGVGNMLGMLTMRINTIMVSLWVNIATVGDYAAATKIMEIGMIIPSLIAQLLMSRLAYSFNTQGKRDPNRFGGGEQVVFALVVPTCVGAWVFAGPILETLFGTGFGNAQLDPQDPDALSGDRVGGRGDERHLEGGQLDSARTSTGWR